MIKKAVSSIEYELFKVWSDEKADYQYTLVHYTDEFYFNELSKEGEVIKVHDVIATGNLEWAKRISEHYNIKIPK